MEFVRTFFTLNRDIIYFGYGLVFFVLGLAIALQSRSYSRLDLARSLKWLAAFGFAHGLHEWGDLFIPIQSTYLNPVTISLLVSLHLLLLAVSYAFLFEFGVALLKPLGSARWLHGVSSALFAIWFFLAFFLLRSLFPDGVTWHNIANALARYFIGFPGGLLAAYALRKHTMQRILPLQVPHIVQMLRFGGVMLALYSIFGGLVTPVIPFFPGNLINTLNFEAFLVVPVPVIRSLVGLGLTIAIIRALEVFDVETGRMIEAMEQQQILAAERDRIARDLHDGAIQKVYTAGLLVESALKLPGESNEILAARLEKAENVLNDAIGDLRRNLGELYTSPGKDSFPDALSKLAEDPRFGSLVNITLNLDLPAQEPLSPVRADHILSVVNEALSNVVRHARAKNVAIDARYVNGRLKLSVQDDGSGLDAQAQAGFGLRNMRDRARLLGGRIDYSGANGKGTRIELDVPWRDEH